MSFIAFKISDFEHTAEREQYRSICNLLHSKYDASDELCVFIANYNIFDCEFDGIIIKNDALIAIEFKNYGGNVRAVENGHWTLADGTIIKGGSRKSVYQQAKLNHVAIKRGLKEGGILPNKMLKNIPSLIVFAQPIILQNNLSEKVKSWLHICDTIHFIDKVEDITETNFYLNNEQIIELLPRLGLLDEFVDSRFTADTSILSKRNSVLMNQEDSQSDLFSEAQPKSLTDSITEVNEIETDSIKNEYHHFIDSQVLPAIGLTSEYKLMIVDYKDFYSVFSLQLPFTSEFVAVLQADNVPSHVPMLKRLFNKDVVTLSSEVICWGEGDFELDDSICLKQRDIKASSISEKIIGQTVVDNFMELKLPSWLDDYIFNELEAKYQPAY